MEKHVVRDVKAAEEYARFADVTAEGGYVRNKCLTVTKPDYSGKKCLYNSRGEDARP